MNDNSGIIVRLRQASREYSDNTVFMHEAIASSVGLSITDHKYLGLLADRGKITSGELATLTGLTTGAVTGLVDRLEKKGFVKRTFDRDDRRKVFIETEPPQIAKLILPIFSENKQRMDEILSKFSNDELETITNYLETAATFMKNRAVELKQINTVL